MQDGDGTQHQLSTVFESHDSPVRQPDKPCDTDSELVSLTSVYCIDSQNKADDMQQVNRSKTSTVAAENVIMKMADKAAKQQKCDKVEKSFGVLNDITHQVNVPGTETRTNNSGREKCAFTGGKAVDNVNDNRYKRKKTINEGTLPRLNFCKRQSVKMTKAAAGDGGKPAVVDKVNSVKVKTADKTAKKWKCDRVEKSAVIPLSESSAKVSVPGTKSRKNKTVNSCVKECTYLLRSGKSAGKVNDPKHKRNVAKDMTSRRTDKVTEALTADVATDAAEKSSKEDNGVSSSSKFSFTESSRRSIEAGIVYKQADVIVNSRVDTEAAKTVRATGAACSAFHMNLRSRSCPPRTGRVQRNSVAVDRKERKDIAAIVKEVKKERTCTPQRSDMDMTARPRRRSRSVAGNTVHKRTSSQVERKRDVVKAKIKKERCQTPLHGTNHPVSSCEQYNASEINKNFGKTVTGTPRRQTRSSRHSQVDCCYPASEMDRLASKRKSFPVNKISEECANVQPLTTQHSCTGVADVKQKVKTAAATSSTEHSDTSVFHMTLRRRQRRCDEDATEHVSKKCLTCLICEDERVSHKLHQNRKRR